MSNQEIDTVSFHICPRCGGHDVVDLNDRGLEAYRCATCGLDERVATENLLDEPATLLRKRWRNLHRKQATIVELQARMEATNARFDETERAKTWPLEREAGPTSREERAAHLEWARSLHVAEGWPPKGYPENDELLAAVLASPDDDEPRLAYAAWQRDQDYEYASIRSSSIAWFIEAQVAAARALRADPKADLAPLLARPSGRPNTLSAMRGGVTEWGESDLDALRGEGLIDHMMFFRGFIEHVAVKAHRFLEIADELLSLAPIRHLTITYVKGLGHDDPGVLRALAASPHLARIRSIELPARMFDNHFTRLNRLTDDDLEVLASSSHLRNLAWLDLEDAEAITPAGLAHLVRSPHLPALSFVGLDLHRYFRELGDFGKYASELRERRIDSLVAALRRQGLDAPWFDPLPVYGTPRPDREAVVEHPCALRAAP